MTTTTAAISSSSNLLEEYDMENASGLGIGALARVLRATHRTTGTTAAVKVLSKLQLLQMQKVEAIKMEKRILQLFGRHSCCIPPPPSTTTTTSRATTTATYTNHHVASLIGTAQSDDELYLFMEELTGGDLQEHLSRVAKMRASAAQCSIPTTTPSSTNTTTPTPSSSSSRWLPGLFCLHFKDVQLIMGQLIDALEPIHTHPNGFTLRDIKSENICFDGEGVLTLIDFDAADEQRGLEPECNFGDPLGRRREEQQLKDLSKNPTSSSSTLGAQQARLDAEARRKTVSEIQGARKMSLINFVGTTQFVSPELLGQMKWSYASDLWAVGVVLYQCVFGRYPFDGSNPFEIMKEIVRGVEPWKHFPLYHDERVAVVQKTTSTTPSQEPLLFTEDQYAAVCDLIEELLQLDPVRRIGVPGSANLRSGSSSSSSIPPSLNRAVPEYSQLRSHAFFEGFDWSGLRGRVEEAVRRSTTTPSSSPSSSLKDMYTIPPTHDEEYSVEVDDACAVGSPLTDWVVGHVETDSNIHNNPSTTTTTTCTATVATPQSERDSCAAKMEDDLKAISVQRAWVVEYEREHVTATNNNKDDGATTTATSSSISNFATQVFSRHIVTYKLHLDLEADDVRESGQHALKEMDVAIERKRLLEKRKLDEMLLLGGGGEGGGVASTSSSSHYKSTPLPLGVSNPYAPTTERLDAIDIRRIMQESDEDDTDHRIVDDVGVQHSYQPVHDDFQ